MKDLNGVRGWLLFYFIVPGILGPISTFGVEPIGSLMVITASIIGMTVFKPWVRVMHIVLYAIALAGGISLQLDAYTDQQFAEALGVTIGCLIWLLYWINSSRVRQTYQDNKWDRWLG